MTYRLISESRGVRHYMKLHAFYMTFTCLLQAACYLNVIFYARFYDFVCNTSEVCDCMKIFFTWKLHGNYIYYTCYIGKTYFIVLLDKDILHENTWKLHQLHMLHGKTYFIVLLKKKYYMNYMEITSIPYVTW